MLDNKNLIKKLEKEAKGLENKIKYRHLYNIKNLVIKLLLKLGISFDYAIPFIIVAIITFNIQKSFNSTPFSLDEREKKASVQETVTSTGYHNLVYSFDYNYSDFSFLHTTGWLLNEYGLYERQETSYKLSENLDWNSILQMMDNPKEEFEKNLIITNIKKEQKNSLSEEDLFYKESMVIAQRSYEDDDKIILTSQSATEDILEMIIFLAFTIVFGSSITYYKNHFIKHGLGQKIENLDTKLKILTKDDVHNLKKILEIKKDNLALLEENATYNEKIRIRKVIK